MKKFTTNEMSEGHEYLLLVLFPLGNFEADQEKQCVCGGGGGGSKLSPGGYIGVIPPAGSFRV